MLDKLLRTTDFDQIPAERRGPVLEHRRRQILENALRHAQVAQVVFAKKTEIARFFREVGGEQHSDIAILFENLLSPTDIFRAAPDEIKQKSHQRVADTMNKTKWEFFVFGEALSNEQVGAIKKKNSGIGKHGNQIPIDTLGLFRCKQNGGPIYLNVEKTATLMDQLRIITTLRPDLIQRLYFIECSGSDEVITKQYKDENPAQIGTEMQHLRAVAALGEYLSYRPKQGDVFMGTVVGIDRAFIVVVEFLPGITGEVNISNEDFLSDKREDYPVGMLIDENFFYNKAKARYPVGMNIKVKIFQVWGNNGIVMDSFKNEDSREEIAPPHKLQYDLHRVDEDAIPLFEGFSSDRGLPLLEVSTDDTNDNNATQTLSDQFDVVDIELEPAE